MIIISIGFNVSIFGACIDESHIIDAR